MPAGQRLLLIPLTSALASGLGSRAGAQEIPRDEYLRHIPVGLPRLAQQGPASADLTL
jgi:hypothetical protein